jgi:DNA invertase Pin-like site-specific DNA recombinase
MERAIAYLRVSTQQQQRSGLGIEAQRATIQQFAAVEGLTIAGEYAEYETGKGADALDRRPQLAAALAAARALKCSILVSKLDRLSRDVAFVSGLMRSGCRSLLPNSVAMLTRSCCTCTPPWRKRNAG